MLDKTVLKVTAFKEYRIDPNGSETNKKRKKSTKAVTEGDSGLIYLAVHQSEKTDYLAS